MVVINDMLTRQRRKRDRMHIWRLALIRELVVKGTRRVGEVPTSELTDPLDVLDDLREGRP